MRYFSENFDFIVATLESTPGTMETITAADFNSAIFNPTFTMAVDPDDENAKYANGNHSETTSVMGIQHGTITGSIKLRPADTITSAPNYAKWLQACGLVEVTYAGTGWGLQTLKSGDITPLTIWGYKLQRGDSPNAKIYKFSGCKGDGSITNAGVGAPIMAELSFSCKLVSVDEVASASIPEINDLETTCFERMLAGSFTIDTIGRNVDGFTLALGNEVSMLKDLSDSTGIAYFGITKRSPRLTCSPLIMAETGGVTNDYTYFYGSETGCPPTPAIAIASTNATITMPKCQLSAMTPVGRDGLSAYDMTWRCLGNGYTGNLADSDLPAECTIELLFGTRS
jgi:hypothetical protein